MKNKYALIALVLLLLGIGLNLFSANGYSLADYYTYYGTDYEGTIRSLSIKYGTAIEYKITPEFVDIKDKGNVDGKVTELDGLGLARLARLLPEILGHYPDELVGNNIDKLKLCRTLSFHDVGYGGTYHNRSLYMASEGKYGQYTDEYIRRIFHHEFSSVLMKNYSFPYDRWMKANPEELVYLDANDQMLKSITSGRDLQSNESLYKLGLIEQYGYSGLENDFNLYAEMLFVDPQKFKKLISQYPAIAKKYQVLKEFYISINDSFIPAFTSIES